MAEESLRMVVFKWLHPAGTPEEPQTHLLLGKFLGPLHTVVMALGLQVNIQQHTQPLQLVGQQLVAGPRATQLLVAHIDFTLHGPNVVIIAVGFLPFQFKQSWKTGGMEE